MSLIHDIIVYATHDECPKTEPSPQMPANRRKLSLDIRLTVECDSNMESKNQIIGLLLEESILTLVRELPANLSVYFL
jgi:hypothetical protein